LTKRYNINHNIYIKMMIVFIKDSKIFVGYLKCKLNLFETCSSLSCPLCILYSTAGYGMTLDDSMPKIFNSFIAINELMKNNLALLILFFIHFMFFCKKCIVIMKQ